MLTTGALWRKEDGAWPAGELDTRQSTLTGALPSSSAGKRKRAVRRRPGSNPRAQQAQAYLTLSSEQVAAWWAKTKSSSKPPSAEQEAFLQRVVARCRAEQRDFSACCVSKAKNFETSEPLRDCLFGIPGAGKSQCIKWVRDLFETCLGWQDGVQFQFLASQNTMAALIGGTTVHSWGVIPVNATDAQDKLSGKSKDGDIDALFLNALGMRWLIVDEVSTLSPEVLGLLDSFLRRACKRHPHARLLTNVRPFGGTRQTLS